MCTFPPRLLGPRSLTSFASRRAKSEGNYKVESWLETEVGPIKEELLLEWAQAPNQLPAFTYEQKPNKRHKEWEKSL